MNQFGNFDKFYHVSHKKYQSTKVAEHLDCKYLNRWKEIHTYDHSRVLLTYGHPLEERPNLIRTEKDSSSEHFESKEKSSPSSSSSKKGSSDEKKEKLIDFAYEFEIDAQRASDQNLAKAYINGNNISTHATQNRGRNYIATQGTMHPNGVKIGNYRN